MLLETVGLTKRFDGLVAVSGVDLVVREGEIRGIIGPNGSGKSTVFNLISGIYKSEPGSRILFEGEEITDQEPHEIARRGIGRTFQLLRLFLDMTVLENLLVGHHSHVGYGLGAAVLGAARVRTEERQVKDEMMELLEFIGLADYAAMPATELSIGQRRLLSLGRAMAMRPKLLMLDEPAAGLSPVNVDSLLNTVFALKERYGLTLIIIEHIMKVVMESCAIVTVLEHGEKIAEGPPAEIKDDHRVIEAYLGKEMDDAEVRAFLEAS
jgi:branched-chain amino acid transport system ATP-binding protein